jgi:hypothetical protein
MVVYAAVPTKGLTKQQGHDYSKFLTFAATTGQTPGVTPGDLPAGYLPMTASNGLGGLASYTKRAAAAVAAQAGALPALVASSSGPSAPGPTTSSGPPSGEGTGSGSASQNGGGTPALPGVSTSPAPGSGGSTPAVAPAPNSSEAALGVTQLSKGGLGSELIPLLAFLIILSSGGAALLKAFGPRAPK